MNETQRYEELWNAIAFSEMFGVRNEHQAKIFALACLKRNVDPLYLAERYHLIGGKDLSMKSETVLAEFIAAGGTYQVVEATGDACEIAFTMGDGTLPVRIEFSDIENESWVRNRDGSFKQNYRSAFGRSDMLWARTISRGVKRMAPGVLLGKYPPEVVADFSGTQLRDDEKSAPAPVVPPEEAAGPVRQLADERETVMDSIANAVRSLGGTPDDLKKICTDRGKSSLHDFETNELQKLDRKLWEKVADSDQAIDESEDKAHNDVLNKIAQLRAKLQVPPESFQKALEGRGAKKINDLSPPAARNLLEALEKIAKEEPEPFEENVDDPISNSAIDAIKAKLDELDQTCGRGERASNEFLEAWGKTGLQKLSDLTVDEGRRLALAIETKNLDEFFASKITGHNQRN